MYLKGSQHNLQRQESGKAVAERQESGKAVAKQKVLLPFDFLPVAWV
jgi:hypothetical protein